MLANLTPPKRGVFYAHARCARLRGCDIKAASEQVERSPPVLRTHERTAQPTAVRNSMDGRCGGACGRGGRLPIAAGGVRSIYGRADDDSSTEHRGGPRGRGAVLIPGRPLPTRLRRFTHRRAQYPPLFRRHRIICRAAGCRFRKARRVRRLATRRWRAIRPRLGPRMKQQLPRAANQRQMSIAGEAGVVHPTGCGIGYGIARNTDVTSARIDSTGSANRLPPNGAAQPLATGAAQRRGASGRRWTAGAGRFSATVGRD